MKKSNLGYALVLIAALMWGTIGIFVNGISALGVSSQSMAAVVGCRLNGSGLGIYGLPGRRS